VSFIGIGVGNDLADYAIFKPTKDNTEPHS